MTQSHAATTHESTGEDPAYLTSQLITCIGNKRSLLPAIGRVVDEIRSSLGGRRLRTVDAFAGSGAVTRLLKSRSSMVIANDLEDYARVLGECYLRNTGEVNWPDVHAALDHLRVLDRRLDDHHPGFIERLYAPADESRITASDRVFYTKMNARRLDVFRQALDQADPVTRTMLLGPLLAEASVHANTAGVFKGFYKDRQAGIGRFGGSGDEALSRITGPIVPRAPVLSAFECDHLVLQVDANDLPDHVGDLDIAYLDPPYNQHPYGSNYFMLNLLATYQEPETVSRVSGIPTGWNRSDYNVRSRAAGRLADLVARLDARYLVVSYNDEGFVPPAEMRAILGETGTVTEYAIPYNTFRGSRNLAGRAIHVTEHLFVVKKR
jgi:adenine-specific DNA-methyltransferase